MEVAKPDPRRQHEATPARVKASGRWVEWLTGEGEALRPVKWSEWRSRILRAEDHTVAEMIDEVHRRGGREKTSDKKGALAGLVELYAGRHVSEEELSARSEAEFEAEVDDIAVRQGRWGLGCPYGCGRSWEFKPPEDLDGFEPEDPAASRSIDLEGNPTSGYLDWRPRPDGSTAFTCDRCGGEVTLR